MSDRPHRKLMKCHVLFLGDSTPEQTQHGLQSLQEPLMRCYPVDSPEQVEGIDSWLTVFTSGILLQYVGNRNETPMPIWFPIQNLHLAAATKCINYIDKGTGQRMETEFVDINNPVAQNSSHPPLFSIIVRKASGKRVLRCYTFLVKDEYPAEMLVDASKYAFTTKSGWSEAHPPEQLIKAEMVPGTDDPDDIDQFDSVSTAGRRSNQPGNQSQSDTETNRNKPPFPAHLVKKYTLSSASRGTELGSSTSPRRPIPREFLGSSSLRSIQSGVRVGHPSIPPQMLDGSIRTTSSVRVVRDPRTRAPVVERVIREEIPVPFPVYQPPPPPQIIEKPVYIPQPPEIRHVPVEKEVPVPVPVPYQTTEPPYQDFYRKRGSKHKSHKHHTFKNYQLFDDRFIRPDYERSSFFANRGEPYNFAPPPHGFAVPPNANYRIPGEFYHMRGGRNRKSGGRQYSSSGETSDEEYRGRQRPREYNPNSRNQGIVITELHSPDERSKSDERRDRQEREKNLRNYNIDEIEKKASGLRVHESNRNGVAGPEFKWSAMPSSPSGREREKTSGKQKRSERKSYYESSSPERGQVYVGAERAEKPRSSYHLLGDPVIEELKQREKEKKKRGKTTDRVEEYPDYNGASTSKEYFFKEQTEAPPRNWMDQKKEYMNERAFSSSLVNDPDSNITNAYALNRGPEDDTMLDRSMGGGVPIPPPLPPDLRVAAGMY